MNKWLKNYIDKYENKEPVSIPDAREQLREWAEEWGKPELSALADRMVRRKPKHRVAKATRRSLTPELAAEIREYKRLHPTMANRDVGEVFNVDGGRVSEAIHNVK